MDHVSANDDTIKFGVQFINPEAIVSKMDFFDGMNVADFGCGTGYFSLAIGKKLGEKGVVYALDILPQKIEVVTSQARNQGLTNIIPKRANIEKPGGSGLEDDSMDLVVLKDVLFQNKNKSDIVAEGKRVLKPGGKLMIVEWKTDDYSIGPAQELRISKEAAMEMAQKQGFGFEREIDTGNFHYGLLFVK